MHCKSIFNGFLVFLSCLRNEQYKICLKKGLDKHKALCRPCSTVIYIIIIQKSALTSHSKGSNHRANVKSINPVSGLLFASYSLKTIIKQRQL